MDCLEAAGLVAKDRGCALQDAVTLRPKDAIARFKLPDGSVLELDYPALIREGEYLKAQSTAKPSKAQTFSFVSPEPAGRRYAE
jgi:hypothetical protein